MNDLVEFAEHELRLGKRGKDGVSLRDTLETAVRMGSKTAAAELENPAEFPEAVGYVWDWFLALNGKRQPGMSGPAPLLESEVGWFFRNRGIRAQAWELDAIGRLDGVALAAAQEG